MKRRSQPKQRRSRGTYGKKLVNGMMYGPTKHERTHKRTKNHA